MTISVIDIETTGIDPTKDAIVEIAAVDVTADGQIANQRACLVCPPIPIPASASAVHHLMDEDVTGCLPLREVLERFTGSDAYIAHNATFERGFLDQHLGAVKWVCTYKCALRVWPELESHSNQFLRYHLGLASPFDIDRKTLDPHRALSDAIVTAAIFVELMCQRGVKWSDMLRWSAEPALHTILSFGKHRGQRYDAVDPSYLSWIVEKSDLDEGVKWSASYWLGQGREAA